MLAGHHPSAVWRVATERKLPMTSPTDTRARHDAARSTARWLTACVTLLGAALAGCATSAGTSDGSAGEAPVIMARRLPVVGTVLVNGRGHALYMFVPDARHKVTCTGGCAAAWPPVMLPAGSTAKAGPGARSALLGSGPDPSGGRVVTYRGWPLYTYAGDAWPGHATGQGLNQDGGRWYVLRPSGTPVESAP